jgi:hypothetical protein
MQLNKNTVNGTEPLLRLIAPCHPGRRWRSRPHSVGAVSGGDGERRAAYHAGLVRGEESDDGVPMRCRPCWAD